jgi:hypothetical protein
MNTMKFPLGKIFMTPGVAALIDKDAGLMLRIAKLLERHQSGDWGEVDEEDKLANDLSVKAGYRILSAYQVMNQRVWFITQADRSSTTILLPREY